MGQSSTSFEEIKRGMQRGCPTWETAKAIYEWCKYKLYMPECENQKEFAHSLGVSRSRLSQLKNAYAYYLNNRDIVDLKRCNVDISYRLFRSAIKKEDLMRFVEWLDVNGIAMEKCTQKQINQFIEECIEMPSSIFDFI